MGANQLMRDGLGGQGCDRDGSGRDGSDDSGALLLAGMPVCARGTCCCRRTVVSHACRAGTIAMSKVFFARSPLLGPSRASACRDALALTFRPTRQISSLASSLCLQRRSPTYRPELRRQLQRPSKLRPRLPGAQNRRSPEMWAAEGQEEGRRVAAWLSGRRMILCVPIFQHPQVTVSRPLVAGYVC